MRTMYDSVTAADIPANAQLVAGYVDGIYRWSGTDWARFPQALKIAIAVFPSTNSGIMLDVEAGDATPEQAPGWVQMRRARGVDPTVYCAYAAWAQTIQAFDRAQVARPHWAIACYDNVASLEEFWVGGQRQPVLDPDRLVAKQYADPAAGSGGHYDLSVVTGYWPGVDPVPAPPPIPQEEDMDLYIIPVAGGGGIWGYQPKARHLFHIQTPQDVTAFQSMRDADAKATVFQLPEISSQQLDELQKQCGYITA